MRPFRELGGISRALESLDLEGNTLRYHRSPLDLAEEEGESAEAREWLGAAKSMDYSARILIRYCLACAAESVLDKSKQWVSLAEAAGMDKGFEFPIVRFVDSETALLETDHPDNKTAKGYRRSDRAAGGTSEDELVDGGSPQGPLKVIALPRRGARPSYGTL
jgi:hypothetical protein